MPREVSGVNIENLRRFAVPEHQANATLNQAAPVQNTWYTILATTTNARILLIGIAVAVANETLECRLTVDGVVYTGIQAAIAGTIYGLNFDRNGNFYTSIVDFASYRAFLIEGRSVTVEVRKTTATGAGALTGQVMWARW